MMLVLLSVAETQADPIWLRTLSIALPVIGAIVVAAVTGRYALRQRTERQNSGSKTPNTPGADLLTGQAEPLPPPVAVAVTEVAAGDPILRLFIDDLHNRLSRAHEEAARLHQLRSVDASTIARLTTELADKEERLTQLEEALRARTTQARLAMQEVQNLTAEVTHLRERLAECMRENQP